MASLFVVKLELNKGANKMAIFGKGGYDSPENKKRIKTKKFIEEDKKEQGRRRNKIAAEKRAKEKGTMLVKDVKGIKDIAKGGKDFINEIKKGAKRIKQEILPTPKEKIENDKTKAQYMKQSKERRQKENKEMQKRNKAKRAGAPDSKGKYVYDAVKRENRKKIMPKHLKGSKNPKKVAKTMTDQVEAMKMVDRNYLKGR